MKDMRYIEYEELLTEFSIKEMQDKIADVQVLASFNVFVPHQAPPSLLNPVPNASASEIESLMRVLTIVISFSIVIVVIVMLRKGKRKRRKKESL
jgi:heme/copper-type cytochrome/quinol oxidase subunit 2